MLWSILLVKLRSGRMADHWESHSVAETSDDKLHRLSKGLRLFTQTDRQCGQYWDSIYGIPDTIVTIIQNLYKGSRSCVKLNGVSGDWFEVVTGVRQGCTLGPISIAVRDRDRLGTSQWQISKDWNGWMATSCATIGYADDIALIETSVRHRWVCSWWPRSWEDFEKSWATHECRKMQDYGEQYGWRLWCGRYLFGLQEAIIHKDLADISYTSRVIADFVPNFVAMATGVGRSRICLASFNSATTKTPCYTQRSRGYLLHRPSYSRFCPKFRCHGNGGWRSRICLASFNSPIPKYAKIARISLI